MQISNEPRKLEGRSVTSILEVANVFSGERSVLAEFDFLIEAPNWTRDGRQLIYNSLGRLYTFDLTSRESEIVYSGYAIRCNNDHVLSPDNSLVAVSHHTNEDGQSRIYTFPLKGGNPILITPMAPSYLHGWSPDGNTLAYCAERNGEYNIYTIPVNGGIETQLTCTTGMNDGPEYSPSGKHIWFNSVRTGLMQVWRMNTDGSEQVQMTFEESNNWFPHVSPDGEWVAYISYSKSDVSPSDHPANKNVEIRVMPTRGGKFHTVVKLFGGQGTLNVNSWSPDSKKLAFVSYRLQE
ncbi:TolB family protein [Paenibacillus massiliensis]|uniref:TolB family protein n=1 Tax=Paenibacillus massiliensis TaxID=225917 RepID=UPI000369348F|nr:PD40 domain-containing protein [Paenibacillus massiliensis]